MIAYARSLSSGLSEPEGFAGVGSPLRRLEMLTRDENRLPIIIPILKLWIRMNPFSGISHLAQSLETEPNPHDQRISGSDGHDSIGT
jgi:hypothetical protein